MVTKACISMMLMAAEVPLSVSIVVGVFVLVMVAMLGNFIRLLPYIADSMLRARGSAALESSVRVSRDRNTVALAMSMPLLFLVWRYRLYDAAFLSEASPDLRFWLIAAVLAGYIFLRGIIYLALKPRRNYDVFQTAHRVMYTFIILVALLLLFTAGALSVFNVQDSTIRIVLYIEILTVYVLLLLRKAQILSLSCNHLRTFLYLCALEILPTAALAVSAILL